MEWLVKQNLNDIQLCFTITLSLIGCLCLFPHNRFYSSLQKSEMGLSLTHAGFIILNHEEGEIAIGSVGSIVVSRGLLD